MYKELKPLREIHRIQEKLHNEEKTMSAKEKLKLIHCEAEEAKKNTVLFLKRFRMQSNQYPPLSLG
jgi:hypothetical protein